MQVQQLYCYLLQYVTLHECTNNVNLSDNKMVTIVTFNSIDY